MLPTKSLGRNQGSHIGGDLSDCVYVICKKAMTHYAGRRHTLHSWHFTNSHSRLLPDLGSQRFKARLIGDFFQHDLMVTQNSLTYSKGFPCNLTPCDLHCIITCPLFVCWGSRTKNLHWFAINSAQFQYLVLWDNLCFVFSEGHVFTEFWPLQ